MAASLRSPAHHALETLLPPASQVDSSALSTPTDEQFPATLPTMPAPPPLESFAPPASEAGPSSMVRTLRSPPPVAWDEGVEGADAEDDEPRTEKVPTALPVP